MADREIDIERLEAAFAAEAWQAFAAARERALASGQSVLHSENGVIYEVFPDGSRKRIKDVEPPMAVIPGLKVQIR